MIAINSEIFGNGFKLGLSEASAGPENRCSAMAQGPIAEATKLP
ncbi:hypothetical protein [Laspinema sp. D2d]|nr:hypothetical protein [Laspinema sp. D2d]